MTNHPPTTDFGAKALLDVAAEIERGETALKHALLEAARRGNVALITAVVERWISGTVTDALRAGNIKIPGRNSADPLEPCPAPEVTQSSSSQPEDGRF